MSANMMEVNQHAMVEKVVVQGDLSVLNAPERLAYYKQVCESVGLNPLTKPFEYIKLNNKLTLYAKRDATDQLRKIHGVSIKIVAREKVDDLYIVTAQATDKNGRVDESTGAVSLAGLKGEAAANAIMKAETKAKRRVTLSIAGLGLLDETEVGSVPSAVPVHIDTSTGEILDAAEPAITEQQAADLLAMAQEVGADLDNFCKFLRVAKLSDLPASKFDRAVKALEARRAKA